MEFGPRGSTVRPHTEKREGHESDQTTASVDTVAKLGSRSCPGLCKRLLLRSRNPPNYRDIRGCGRTHLEVAKGPSAHQTGHVPSSHTTTVGQGCWITKCNVENQAYSFLNNNSVHALGKSVHL